MIFFHFIIQQTACKNLLFNETLYLFLTSYMEINHKNKLYGWANKNGKMLEFETIHEKMENGRRLFTIGAVVDGKIIAEGKAFNKKDASQIASQLAVDLLGIGKEEID